MAEGSPASTTTAERERELKHMTRRALAAETSYVAAAASRARLTRKLEQIQATLVDVDASVSASEQRRIAAEAEVARLQVAITALKAKRQNKKRRSMWSRLRRRLAKPFSGGGNEKKYPQPSATLAPAVAPAVAASSVPMTILESVRRRFEPLDPLRTYPEPRTGYRVTIVTDSINPGLLYGGVGTAIVLGTLLANRLGGDLRLITRVHEADPGQIGSFLATFGMAIEGSVGCVFSPPRAGSDVPVFAGDLFVVTSWWSAQAAMSAVDPAQIVYLLQEDERMFYPRGDERMRCAEVLGNDRIRFVVNSQLLFRHFAQGDEPLPNIASRGCWFEPAFLETHYFDSPRLRRTKSKKTFLFYARPNNLRNMYWRGLEAVAAAIEEGVLSPEDWTFVFVGRDLEPVALPRGVRPKLIQNLPWAEYAALIREVDLGLSLIDTPHPSYPPLDMAASGAVVVTNRCGVKQSLSAYSENIICAEPSVRGMCDGLQDAVAIVADEPRRAANYCRNGIRRDWSATLEDAVRFAMRLDG